MQPIMSAMVANSERMRLFFGLGRPSLGALLRISWTIAVAMVATAPIIAARMVSERPIYVASSKLPRVYSGTGTPQHEALRRCVRVHTSRSGEGPQPLQVRVLVRRPAG